MAQLQRIGLYKPCINPPFGDCAMYFDHGVSRRKVGMFGIVPIFFVFGM